MTRIQTSLLSAIRNAVGILMGNLRLFADRGGLVDILNQAKARIDRIEALAVEQERGRAGVTADRDQARERLLETLLTAAGAFRVWAAQTKQVGMAERVPLTRTYWNKVSDAKLAERAMAILELMRPHWAELKPYGVTDQLFSELGKQITAFEGMAGATRNAVTRRKTKTLALEQELRELTKLLDEQIEPLLISFKAAEFYAAYQQARIPVRPARTPMETIRERALARTAMSAARKEAKAARVAAKAAAKEALKAEKRSRLEALTLAATGSNGSTQSASSRAIAAQPVAAGLAN